MKHRTRYFFVRGRTRTRWYSGTRGACFSSLRAVACTGNFPNPCTSRSVNRPKGCEASREV